MNPPKRKSSFRGTGEVKSWAELLSDWCGIVTHDGTRPVAFAQPPWQEPSKSRADDEVKDSDEGSEGDEGDEGKQGQVQGQVQGPLERLRSQWRVYSGGHYVDDS